LRSATSAAIASRLRAKVASRGSSLDSRIGMAVTWPQATSARPMTSRWISLVPS
jgi:hypothetical protein